MSVEEIQQRVAAASTAELLSRRAVLLAVARRWQHGAYGQQLDGLAEFELDAITAELRGRLPRAAIVLRKFLG